MNIEVRTSLAWPNLDGIPQAMQQAMDQFGILWTGRFIRERLSGRPGLERRTGNLARSFLTPASKRVESQPGSVTLTIGSHGPGSEYSMIHETGGTITPREAIERGEFVANGVFFASPRRARGQRQVRRPATPLFALRDRVEIPARMGAGAFLISSLPMLQMQLGRALRAGIPGNQP